MATEPNDETDLLALLRDGFVDAPKDASTDAHLLLDDLHKRFPQIPRNRILELVRLEASRHGVDAPSPS